jgi:hypothetical protein
MKKIVGLIAVAVIVFLMFSVIAAEATFRAGSTDLTSIPDSTPILKEVNGSLTQIPQASGQNHWWMIDYWATQTGGNLPSFMNGSFVAVNNTIGGFVGDDAILYLPLNVAYGTSATNCVWFQFDVQFNSTGVSWYIWDIEGPGTVDSDYKNIPIPTDVIPYTPGHGYSFSLTTSGAHCVTFTITDTTTMTTWSTCAWAWTVPSLNMLYNPSYTSGGVTYTMFSPASAVEGYTTNSQLTGVPHFRTLVGYGITNFWYGAYGSGAPSGIATYASVGPSGNYYWSMYNGVAPSVTISPSSAVIYYLYYEGTYYYGSATFTATVSNGASPYYYQWYLNSAPVSGATSASWTFTPSKVSSYTVYVTVTDSVGMEATSNTATVTLEYMPGGCVLAGTRILMADDKEMPVQDVKPGDEIMGYDVQTGTFVVENVTSNNCTVVNEVLSINNGLLCVTPTDQPIFTDHGWIVNPQDLKIGWRIYDPTHNSWITIQSLKTLNGHFDVYDLRATAPDTFIGNGVLLDRKVLNP